MKYLRFALFVVVVMLLSIVAFAQADTQKPPSDAQKSFDTLKSLAGSWQGPVTTVPTQAGMGDGGVLQVSLRVTSRGNALVHEMKEAGTPDDPVRYDHPVTIFYLDSERLLLTHYCDAGNRPRMTGKMSPDGKTIEFEFVDISGSMEYHMHHAAFTIIDANHHTEDWTFMMKDKPVRAHFDLQRTK